MSNEEMDSFSFRNNLGYGSSNDVLVTQIDFSEAFNSKKGRISKYREMSLFPEISDAIDYICDEAIVDDPENDNKIIDLQIDSSVPSGMQKRIKTAFDYLVNDVLDFNEKGWDYFKKWLLEGELYMENILSQDKKDLIGVKVLPSFTMFPIYDGLKIIGYAQIISKDPQLQKEEKIVYTENQVIYSNYGLYGKNLIDVRGFLESAIRPYNQLRNLEDALIVTRLVRAPERRIWNINVGRLPKGKAEEYIKQLIEKYKKKNVYDPATGAINSAMNIQALSEDYWFAKNEEGKGTDVSTLNGSTQLGELSDVNYFLSKLYKTLKLPKSRYENQEGAMFSGGRSGEINREEVKFSNFVKRLQRRFKNVIYDPLVTLLKMRGIDEQYISKDLLNIEFTKNNAWKEYADIELLDSRFGLLGSASSYLVMPGQEGQALFSKEFVLRKYFNMSDEDYKENEKLKQEEIEEIKEQGLEGQGQFGNQFGQPQDQFGGEIPQEENPLGTGNENPDVAKEDRILSLADNMIAGKEAEPEEKEEDDLHEIKPKNKKKKKKKIITETIEQKPKFFKYLKDSV